MDLSKALTVAPGLTLRSIDVPKDLLLKHKQSLAASLYLDFETASLIKDLHINPLNLDSQQALELDLKWNPAYPIQRLWEQECLDGVLRRESKPAKDAYDRRHLFGPDLAAFALVKPHFKGIEGLGLHHLPYLGLETLEGLAQAPRSSIHQNEDLAKMCGTYLLLKDQAKLSAEDIASIRNHYPSLQVYARYSDLSSQVLFEEILDYCHTDALLNPNYNPRLEHHLDFQHPNVLRKSAESLGVSQAELHQLIEYVGPQDSALLQNQHSLENYQDYFALHPLPYCDGLFMLRLMLDLAVDTPTDGPTYTHWGFFRYGPKADVLRAITPLLFTASPNSGICYGLDILALREDIDHQEVLCSIDCIKSHYVH